MVIQTRKYKLKYRTSIIDISKREQKLILILSDNKLHSIREIRRYIGFVTDIGTSALIRKLNQRIKNEIRINLIIKKLDKYQIKQQIYIS